MDNQNNNPSLSGLAPSGICRPGQSNNSGQNADGISTQRTTPSIPSGRGYA
jgi:hypothetical protein